VKMSSANTRRSSVYSLEGIAESNHALTAVLAFPEYAHATGGVLGGKCRYIFVCGCLFVTHRYLPFCSRGLQPGEAIPRDWDARQRTVVT
jgi:hypothetical protein